MAFRWLLVVIGGATLGLTLGGSAVIARRALAPVAAMTATAHTIARSRDFSHRVSPPGAPDELGDLATTFNEMLAALEQAYDTQRRFVSDASHELRTPLTAIQANLELLETLPDLPPDERREAVTEARRETIRLSRLVADLLTLARADSGAPLRLAPVDLDQVLLDVLGEARHLVSGQRLGIDRLVPMRLVGDPDRLKQLVLILVDNAIKYTPAGGRITLGLAPDGAALVLTVADTGVGIPAADLPRVFDRFYRADPARSRDPGGTGLGLAIARWIAREHGGDISICSAPEHGTTVTVRLPRPT